MSELALNADGLVLGVPLSGLVWDPETAMDRALAELDDSLEWAGDDHIAYWPIEAVSDGG